MFVMISENHLYYPYDQENGYAVQRCRCDSRFSRVLKQQRANKFRKVSGLVYQYYFNAKNCFSNIISNR